MGIAGMKVGGLRRLTIPSDLAYGARAKGKIPADSRLTFTVELMSIRDAPAQPQRPAPRPR
ncbi:FKBP-type peptidyl-prolyl cis-trans isomerase [Enhygromyxa salina]|nr:FKBP-type peptidyl-prolyl cis-trans isomerase [Enhygromyxa salina]PRP96400.1 FK506-binding protein [Enhygromyxa salina]